MTARLSEELNIHDLQTASIFLRKAKTLLQKPQMDIHDRIDLLASIQMAQDILG